MKLSRFASAAFIAASLAAISPATAAPLSPVSIPTQNMVELVGGCHAGVRRHYVPQFGRTTSHFHRRNCNPVRASSGGGNRDCHRNVRRHYLPQYGGSVVHRHVGENCRVRLLRRYDGGGGGFCVTLGIIRYCER